MNKDQINPIHNTITNQFNIECSGITPDGVDGLVAAGIPGYFIKKMGIMAVKKKHCRIIVLTGGVLPFLKSFSRGNSYCRICPFCIFDGNAIFNKESIDESSLIKKTPKKLKAIF